MSQDKSKVTIYVRPELHKLLKLRSVEMDMKMSELAELMLERYLLESPPEICPECKNWNISGATDREKEKIAAGARS